MRKNNSVLAAPLDFFSEIPSGIETEPKTESKNDQGQATKQVVYLPDFHPKLIHFLKTSPSLKQTLDEEMKRAYAEIDWPTSEDGKTHSSLTLSLSVSEVNSSIFESG